MKLLYLIANQSVEPSAANFIAKVARQTNSSVHVLAAASNAKDLKRSKKIFPVWRKPSQELN